ncbi:hypothetical protein EFBL_1166 [Effusibacillus lacus]|uniref:Uncharacterized protein n=1 Tax=Effusibacillus lacus TaxID=1348429 RepID=A0A292YCV4_9BACL|nr:hypothetical protein EDD64_13236 [Effusibacillus lacus]GAX89542.1 hypothetical protein EFBL_1166 [Effusibacillus lacus]
MEQHDLQNLMQRVAELEKKVDMLSKQQYSKGEFWYDFWKAFFVVYIGLHSIAVIYILLQQ